MHEEASAAFRRRLEWTAPLRRRLLRSLRLPAGTRVLEVGCGPGLLLAELEALGWRAEGLEADPWLAGQASAAGHRVHLGRAEELPFPDGTFDVALCHLVLLWLPDPPAALREMARVVRSGGRVVALAEPDLQARIDWPELGYAEWMSRFLRARGGHPDAGRRLAEWFVQAGLQPRLRGGHRLWTARELRRDWEAEWEMWSRELRPWVGEDALERWRAEEEASLQRGTRLLAQSWFAATARVRSR